MRREGSNGGIVARQAYIMRRIGVISDTHGLLRPEAAAFLRGSDFVIHGGDIGHEGILKELASVAPVTAVRGNNDHGPWGGAFARTRSLHGAGGLIFVSREIAGLDLEPVGARCQVG